VVRRSAFEAVGGFDERLFMYCEDVDLSYRLAAHGRLVHVSDAHFEHSSGDRPLLALHRNFRNWLVVQRRHRKARPAQMMRDAVWALRQRKWRVALARISATADYLIRAHRWA
jgi:GT2 family glycosyltransferase